MALAEWHGPPNSDRHRDGGEYQPAADAVRFAVALFVVPVTLGGE